MGRSSWMFALAVLVGVAMWGSPAQAQHRRHGHHPHRGQQAQGPSAAQREQARQAYSHGQQLFQDGQFQQAEQAFQQAYSLIPNPVVLLGVAQARESEGNISGAIETLQQYLHDRPDAPDKQQITDKITALRARPASVSVHSTPAGAAVWLDGSDTGKTTPADVSVPPGDHTLSLRLAGHDPFSQALSVEPGAHSQVEGTLQAAAPEPELEHAAQPSGQEMGTGEGQPPPDDTTPTPTEGEHGPGAAVWVSAGIAGAGLVAGTVLGFLALSEQSNFDANPTKATADKGESLALFADVGFGVAAAAAITAIVLYVTGDHGSNESDSGDTASLAGTRVQVAPMLGPTTGGMQARVRF